MIDIGAPNGYSDRMPSWFKIEASNDDENWTLLLERASLTRWYDGETRQYYIDNSTAYRYYKFTPIEIPVTEFRISRLRLYHKIAGQECLQKFIPKLTSATQGGYEITCSSQLNDHLAYLPLMETIVLSGRQPLAAHKTAGFKLNFQPKRFAMPYT
ncbi:hypothetical protein FACS189449_09980 [Alphaproteobacteria bacterium]|nr:hypothetical protein FACS189449_09980 [Alphaproteobacteria bacterium]